MSQMRIFKEQLLPILLTVITCALLVLVLLGVVHGLNLFPTKEKIIPVFRIADILVGITIYLKTSIDFALVIGKLMHNYTGYKNRIAIEIGTALGNGIGTFLVLLIWTFFKEVPLLLSIMIIVAALVLLMMAEDSITELVTEYPNFKNRYTLSLASILHAINKFFSPLTRRILPHWETKEIATKTFLSLAFFAFSIPFILGLDDFAGYIPLFNVVNVAGFATGVFVGHMILNIFLFASSSLTVKIIRQPAVTLFGSIAFIGIALWGLYEVFGIISHLLF